MIRISAAAREDPEFYKEWLAYEKRHARWKARLSGKRPKPLSLTIPVRYPVVRQLMDTYGVLSDEGVHFTPEYFSTLNWEVRENELFLHYFSTEQRDIESAVFHLTATHLQILTVLDYCLDGRPSGDPRWTAMRDQLQAAGRRLMEQYQKRYGTDVDEEEQEQEEMHA